MHRFHLQPEQCIGEILTLAGREAHHALHVLRLQPGQATVVLDGSGTEFRCEVTGTTRDTLRLSVRETNTHPAPAHTLTLLQAIPKGKTIETIIQKATELGVHRIIPLFTERTETHLSAEQAARKQEKWTAIMIEAIKQCGNPWLPTLAPPLKLSRYLDSPQRFDLSLLASLDPEREHPRRRFQDYQARQHSLPASLAVWIGPEGDFSPAEQTGIRATGALPISLGNLVLRADTAAVAALSILTHELTAPAPAPGTPAPIARDGSGS